MGVLVRFAALGLKLLSFVDSQLVADHATDCGAGKGMVVRKVARDRTDCSASNATSIGRARHQ